MLQGAVAQTSLFDHFPCLNYVYTQQTLGRGGTRGGPVRIIFLKLLQTTRISWENTHASDEFNETLWVSEDISESTSGCHLVLLWPPTQLAPIVLSELFRKRVI